MSDANELNPVYLRESVAGANRQLAAGKPRNQGRADNRWIACIVWQSS